MLCEGSYLGRTFSLLVREISWRQSAPNINRQWTCLSILCEEGHDLDGDDSILQRPLFNCQIQDLGLLYGRNGKFMQADTNSAKIYVCCVRFEYRLKAGVLCFVPLICGSMEGHGNIHLLVDLGSCAGVLNPFFRFELDELVPLLPLEDEVSLLGEGL